MRRHLRDPMFSRFDTIPECDRHTHTHTHTDRQTDRHTTTAYTALSKASRGKNVTFRTLHSSRLAYLLSALYARHSTRFSARCNIYISRLCYDVSVRLSVRLSVCDGSALAHYS